MLTSAIMNGFVSLIVSIFNQIRRIVWYKKKSVEVTINLKGPVEQIQNCRINYQDQLYEIVLNMDVTRKIEKVTDETGILLRWIPGTEKTMLSEYAFDSKSQRELFICDMVSLGSFLIMIVALVLGFVTYPKAGLFSEICFYLFFVTIIIMIVTSIVRKKYRKPYIVDNKKISD